MEDNYKYSISKEKRGLYKVSVKVDAQYFAKKRSAEIEKLGAEIEVKGFRKGQVPISVLEDRLGSQATLQVIKVVSFDVASAIIKEKKEPVLSPLNVKNIPQYELGKSFSFDFEFLSAPDIDLKEIKKISIEKPKDIKVEQTEVDKVIEEMWTEDSKQVSAELSKGTPADKTTLLGPDGKPISEVDNVKKDTAATKFDKSKLTDAWAVKIDPSAKTVTGLESKVRELLVARKEQYSNSLFEHNLFDKVAESLDIEAPLDLVEAEMVNREEEFYATARLSGASPVEFLRSQGLSIEKLRETWKAQAQNGIKQLLIITGVSKSAGIEVSDEEIKSEQKDKEKPEQTRIRILRQHVVDYLTNASK